MSREYTIGMLWVEGPLSYVEQLCVQSFLDAGHAVTLYHYGTVSNVPEGVTVEHGGPILDRDSFIQHSRTGSMALFSDVFRYHLLKQSDGMIWADTDAYCVRPFRTDTGHFFGWESGHHINGGVLGLPRDSLALANLLEMTRDEYGIPPWLSAQARDRLAAKRDAGEPTHVGDLPWGTWGPHAITWHLGQTGEDRHAAPRDVLYPVPFAKRRQLVKADRRKAVGNWLSENTLSIHLYGRRIRDFLASRPEGLPDKGGLIDELLAKHGIDPRAAPIPAARTVESAR